jgi:hypothetical protein
MPKHRPIIFLFAVLLALGGCATIPKGPSVMALPGPGKTFEQFQTDDAICRQWAAQRIGASPQEVAQENTAKGAAVGTVIGAGLGAAIGAASGHAGAGAAIGAGSGLLVGAASGADTGRYYGWEAQRRYDIAYTQCMFAKGNDVPGMVRRTYRYRRVPPPPPPGSGYEPPSYSTPYEAPPPPEE